MFELQIGLDKDATVALIRRKVEEFDERDRNSFGVSVPKYRSYPELRAICGDKASSVGASDFNECVRLAVERGYLERSKIGKTWKFRCRKRHHYSASPSRQRNRRTGTSRW